MFSYVFHKPCCFNFIKLDVLFQLFVYLEVLYFRTVCADVCIKEDKRLVLIFMFQVKLDKVDVFYPFHPSSLVDIKNDTRLKFTSQETASWLDDLSE